MLDLFQAEWCPHSRRVRQRLTELGVSYVVRQVPVDQAERRLLFAETAAETIPVLRLENGAAVVGADNILAYLGEHFVDPDSASRHRARAAEMRLRFLEAECECSEAGPR
jgi:glutathione S-transferase